jgi:hypothetical protein
MPNRRAKGLRDIQAGRVEVQKGVHQFIADSMIERFRRAVSE